ncbi:hypothetical protein GOP47_0014536 [Adiantum capillus-veneris]|uniref:Uncharacterized protein n=1 Tax=Adiantum capillus-veneris TaxID=13818 RepID=A0A9D4ZC91_ADICA|nr:hypothetical protein GOP47_0014536 [Adiantum capillus-veneris]
MNGNGTTRGPEYWPITLLITKNSPNLSVSHGPSSDSAKVPCSHEGMQQFFALRVLLASARPCHLSSLVAHLVLQLLGS